MRAFIYVFTHKVHPVKVSVMTSKGLDFARWCVLDEYGDSYDYSGRCVAGGLYDFSRYGYRHCAMDSLKVMTREMRWAHAERQACKLMCKRERERVMEQVLRDFGKAQT